MRDHRLALWGTKPPPIGGVTRSVEAQETLLSSYGSRLEVLAPPRRLPGTSWLGSALRFRQAEWAIFNVSGVRGLSAGLIAATMPRRDRTLFIHGGAITQRLGELTGTRRRFARIMLSRFDDVWVTNDHMATELKSEFGLLSQVVSPYAQEQQPRRQDDETNRSGFVTAAFNAGELYCLQTVVSTLELYAKSREVTLTVLLYGPDETAIAAAREQFEQNEKITIIVEENLPPSAVSDLLTTTETLLRITTSDGDSVLVREAIERGVRVIASNVSPRPSGVELCGTDTLSILDAIQFGAAVSEGDGMGIPLNEAINATAKLLSIPPPPT